MMSPLLTTYDDYVFTGNNTWRGPKGIVKKFKGHFHAYDDGMNVLGAPKETWEDAVRLCEVMGEA